LLFGRADSSGSGEGLFFAVGAAVRFGFEAGRFLGLALRFAGFRFAAGSGVSAGVGEAAVCISSLVLLRVSRFFFPSSVSCASTKVATIALSARAVPRKMRKRITADERNKARCDQLAKVFGIKQAVVSPPQPWRHARAPGEESHSIFRPTAKANRLDTSRSSA
jgi:hypothetical protein